MDEALRKQPRIPMCKLAEYMVTPSSVRRRSIVKGQLKLLRGDSEKRRWWYQEAKGEIRKFFRNSSATRQSLLDASLELRAMAALEPKDSKKETLRASAAALESFAQIAEKLRNKKVVVSAGRREGASMLCCKVRIGISPDLLLLDRTTESVIGAFKFHASQEFKLNTDALLNSASILYWYLESHEDKPLKALCTVADLFVPAYESAPQGIKRRLKEAEASCEQFALIWHDMYDDVLAEAETEPPEAW
jgi:hypothetical protein